MTEAITARIEHVNITVTNPKRSADLFCALFGWHIRWEGPSMLGGHTLHVGDADDYIAVYSNDDVRSKKPHFAKGKPMNHIGIVVDDLDAVEQKVIAAGLEPFSHGDYDPGRRFYFFDWDGIEFEIVSYS
ncbi:VOC family protein [Alterisphingorhabdus coralli]|uniref:VOC family protein n=1 Tax=Alterisphingorhabdus coralli TaxID=3071408 RepID=A0AA97F7P3_9SPHN|nr:VOC family protein [Parasphingorhabdus sp. SCSIO 66989]WOE74991.1 VOC family protein [Parasphingorhabdus sp. SCSIO 66989]